QVAIVSSSASLDDQSEGGQNITIVAYPQVRISAIRGKVDVAVCGPRPRVEVRRCDRVAGTLERLDQLLHVVTPEHDEVGRFDRLVVRAQVERHRVYGDSAALEAAHRVGHKLDAAAERTHAFDDTV